MPPLLLHFKADGVEYVAVSETTLSKVLFGDICVKLCGEVLYSDWGESSEFTKFYHLLTAAFKDKRHRYRVVQRESDFESIAPAEAYLAILAYYKSPNYYDLTDFSAKYSV